MRYNFDEKIWNKISDIWLYAIIVLFFLPFFGTVGQKIFQNSGKYYYAILCVVMAVNFAFRFFFCKEAINYCFSNRYRDGKVLLLAVFIVFFLCMVMNSSFENFAFGIVILLVLIFFATHRYTAENLRGIGILSEVMLYIFAIIVAVRKPDYFNPNTYAEIATVLLLFSCVGSKNLLEENIFTILNASIAVYLAEAIFGSETQLLTIFVFMLLFLARKFFFKNVKRGTAVILAFWAFIIFLPFICYLLIKVGVLQETIFTTRGERWVWSIEALWRNGALSSVDVPGSHNGFLDVCVKYTFMGGILYAIVLIGIHCRYGRLAIKCDAGTVLLCAILSIVFMNSVESMLVGLTDCYFLLILTGILVSMHSDANVLKEKVKEYGKVHFGECRI